MNTIYFKLKEDYAGFKKGVILLKGDFIKEPYDEDGDVGQEYFEITTEMTFGHSYSTYDVPSNLLEPIDEETSKEINKIFQAFINDDYNIEIGEKILEIKYKNNQDEYK